MASSLNATQRLEGQSKMTRIVFDITKTWTPAQLEKECDRLEGVIADFMLMKNKHDPFLASQRLMFLFKHADFQEKGFVTPKQFQSILRELNVNVCEQVFAHWFQLYAEPESLEPQFGYMLFVKGVFGEVAVPHKEPGCREALDRVRELFLRRSKGNMAGLSRSFRIADTSGDRKLSAGEFGMALQRVGIRLSADVVASVSRAFDRDGDGRISIAEFLCTVRGPLSPNRRVLVELAFQQLDKDNSGVVEFAEMKQTYDASRHPDVVAGRSSVDEVIMLFASSWDKDGDGNVTLLEFIDYYKGISAAIDHDDYFELMIRNAWHLSGGEGWAANTANLRVLVEHTDGSQEVVCIDDDLGLDKADMKAVRSKLESQGVTDIKYVSLAD